MDDTQIEEIIKKLDLDDDDLDELMDFLDDKTISDDEKKEFVKALIIMHDSGFENFLTD